MLCHFHCWYQEVQISTSKLLEMLSLITWIKWLVQIILHYKITIWERIFQCKNNCGKSSFPAHNFEKEMDLCVCVYVCVWEGGWVLVGEMEQMLARWRSQFRLFLFFWLFRLIRILGWGHTHTWGNTWPCHWESLGKIALRMWSVEGSGWWSSFFFPGALSLEKPEAVPLILFARWIESWLENWQHLTNGSQTRRGHSIEKQRQEQALGPDCLG